MLVVDTGSSDATPELARRCGAAVHHLDWPDDFSAARNHALDLADADWHLILDADEWIESGGEALRGWCDGPPRLGRICIHSSDDALENPAEGSVSASRSWITRVVPRGARFQGRIHEQVESALPREKLDLHVGHDGYLGAQMAGKRDRNRALLRLDLRDRPDDPYIAYQLGREAEGRDEFSAACEWYGKGFARTPPAAIWFHDLLVRYLHCLGRAGRIDEALVMAEAQMPAWLESPDFFFVAGNLALDKAMADPAAALDQWLPLAVSCWERCLEIGERPELEGSVQGRGSHLAQHNLEVIRSQVGALGR
jgi:glycosyltransferase involved in cell wall biosynthesis